MCINININVNINMNINDNNNNNIIITTTTTTTTTTTIKKNNNAHTNHCTHRKPSLDDELLDSPSSTLRPSAARPSP